ncbi:hypothetical protein [Haloplanus salilacus]|uniref:hypothetical protein n=1 Tax=Haloplanus salilacus TaxID=2949994 RepID=UPI0030CAB260
MHTTGLIVAVAGAVAPLAVPAAVTNGDGDVVGVGPTTETPSGRAGPTTDLSEPTPRVVERLPGTTRRAVTDLVAAGTVG